MHKSQVTLTATEQAIVEMVARMRMQHDRQAGARATVYAGDALKREIESFGAEVAFCKMFGVYPDLNAEHHEPWDAVVKGYTVDVKHTVRPDGRLLVKAKSRSQLPDYYALMTGTYPTYRIVGTIKADDVLKPENLDRNLHYPAYAVPQERLIGG